MKTVTVKDPDILQATQKAKILQNLADKLNLEELKKLDQMSSEKGIKALKNNWSLISNFI